MQGANSTEDWRQVAANSTVVSECMVDDTDMRKEDSTDEDKCMVDDAGMRKQESAARQWSAVNPIISDSVACGCLRAGVKRVSLAPPNNCQITIHFATSGCTLRILFTLWPSPLSRLRGSLHDF
jgi:hypothetical protein